LALVVAMQKVVSSNLIARSIQFQYHQFMDNMCFWDAFQQSSMIFCEQKLCSNIVQPANAFSALFFSLIGFWLQKKFQPQKGELVKIIPIICHLLGVTSFLFHSSFIFFFEVFDVSSMFMLSCLIIVFSLYRFGRISKERFHITYWAMVIFSVIFMITFKKESGEILFAIQLTLGAILEFLYIRKNRQAKYKWLYLSALTYIASTIIWILDVKGILCDPHNHIFQGHAVWHLLNAIAIAMLYLYYSQFNEKNLENDSPGTLKELI
jgi:hypothetical protein